MYRIPTKNVKLLYKNHPKYLFAANVNCSCNSKNGTGSKTTQQSQYFHIYSIPSARYSHNSKLLEQYGNSKCKRLTPVIQPNLYHTIPPISSTFLKINKRNFHLSSIHRGEEEFKFVEEKSKIEDYVLNKRKKLEKEQKLKAAADKFQEAFIFKVDKDLSETNKTEDSVAVTKEPLKDRIIHEIKHYYKGFRLLYLDTRIAARLLWQVLNGKALSRRERKQFLRTVADLFRLVPFSVFVIVPFMEFLLPVAIKLFPDMLPSTFEDKDKKKAKSVASLKMRLQMAEFLQDTIEEISVSSKSSQPSKKLLEFSEFVTKIRSEGEQVSNQQIIKFSKIFEDEITLDNIPYDQLKALCRLLMISPIGTPGFLRFKLRMKLQELKADDVMINQEGVDSLSVEELQNACVARGMRSMGVPVDRLRSNLRQWLEFSLNESIPASLLLLSRTLFMSPTVAVDEQLKVTISQLPERIIDEMEVKIGATEGESVDPQTIIDIIKHEEELIKAEKQEKEEVLKDTAEKLTTDELSKEDILTVQTTLSSEREELSKIREDRGEYIGDVENLKQVTTNKTENIASSRLGKRIDALLDKVDKTLFVLEKDVMELPKGKIDLDDDGIVTTEEIFDAVRKLRNAPDETKTQRLIEVLDEDKDGELDLEELRNAVKLLAEEDLDLSQGQIVEVLELLKGTQKIKVIEQMINKKKTNYLIYLLPRTYTRCRITDQ